MSSIRILYVDDHLVHSISQQRYVTDISFNCLADFNRAVELGFKPEAWEKKNGVRVLIKDEHYELCLESSK